MYHFYVVVERPDHHFGDDLVWKGNRNTINRDSQFFGGEEIRQRHFDCQFNKVITTTVIRPHDDPT